MSAYFGVAAIGRGESLRGVVAPARRLRGRTSAPAPSSVANRPAPAMGWRGGSASQRKPRRVPPRSLPALVAPDPVVQHSFVHAEAFSDGSSHNPGPFD